MGTAKPSNAAQHPDAALISIVGQTISFLSAYQFAFSTKPVPGELPASNAQIGSRWDGHVLKKPCTAVCKSPKEKGLPQDKSSKPLIYMGWLMGLEPTTTGITNTF